MTERKFAFAPAAGPQTRVLVLGSLPGDASLAASQYYAHPRNQFWRLMGNVVGHPDLPGLPYPERLNLLTAAGLGLWDVVASARRRGSLDTAIREAEPAALEPFVAALPGLRAAAFNGARAAATGRPLLSGTGLTLIDLPSSSPAHAALSFESKLERWLVLKDFLG